MAGCCSSLPELTLIHMYSAEAGGQAGVGREQHEAVFCTVYI